MHKTKIMNILSYLATHFLPCGDFLEMSKLYHNLYIPQGRVKKNMSKCCPQPHLAYPPPCLSVVT